MKIDKETIQKIAHLARLEFDATSEKTMIKDLQSMVDWVDKLNEVDTEGVEPLTNMTFEVNRMREDEMKEHLPRERALKHAPDKDEEYFRVPKVLE